MVKMKDDAAALLGQIIALATRGKGYRAFGQITRIAKRALGEVPTPQPRPVRELPDVVQVVARHIDSINHKLARGERGRTRSETTHHHRLRSLAETATRAERAGHGIGLALGPSWARRSSHT